MALASLDLQPRADLVYTVLVVDDDAKAVEVLAAYLPAPGYAVVRAYGGREAIALAARLQPDLVLLDLMMPEVNGFDVVRALSEQPETAAIPILVVTAKQITEADRTALGANQDNIIRIVEKSGFNKVRFLSEVRRALPRK
jgi:CheY-like chemotaxis protein